MNAPTVITKSVPIEDAQKRKADLWDTLFEFGAHEHEALTRTAQLGLLTLQNAAMTIENMARHCKRFDAEKAATLSAAALIMRQEAHRAGHAVCRIEDGGNLYLGEG